MASETLSEATLQRLAQKGHQALSLYHTCSQCTFYALSDEFNLDRGPILKALTPFPGLGGRGETCGAVIGCLMAIGLVYGSDDPADKKAFYNTLPAARSFCSRFVERNGSTACGKILEARLGFSVDFADSDQVRAYWAAAGHKGCSELVISAIQMAAQVIAGGRRVAD